MDCYTSILVINQPPNELLLPSFFLKEERVRCGVTNKDILIIL